MYNNNYMLDSLNRQKERIDEMIRSYQNPQTPINNFINTNQQPVKDMIEWRILNENEEVDNLYVANKTLFINDENMVLKGVDGSLEKWKVTKIYPIDKKDEKINALEEEIRKLKEVLNEPKQSIQPVKECDQSVSNVDEYVEPKPKTTGKSVSK